MNGEEVEGRPRYSAPAPSNILGGRREELTQGEKVDLMMFAQTDISKTLFKLMEIEVIDARDRAMACSPSLVTEQKALMDTAYSMALFYTELRKKINTVVEEHKELARQAEVEEALEDHDFIENVILAQALNQPPPTRSS